MGSRRTARTGPVSRLASRRMMLTPVTWSPAKIARSTGAAPRHRGRSEKWAFSMGVLSRRAAGTIRPYATTTPSSAPEPGTSSIRSVTLSPVSRAACLTGLGASPAPLPRRLSGWLTTTTTSCLASISARSAGTAASGEPRNASRAMSENYRWAHEPRSRRALRALDSPRGAQSSWQFSPWRPAPWLTDRRCFRTPEEANARAAPGALPYAGQGQAGQR